jgi:hypothetical protein
VEGLGGIFSGFSEEGVGGGVIKIFTLCINIKIANMADTLDELIIKSRTYFVDTNIDGLGELYDSFTLNSKKQIALWFDGGEQTPDIINAFNDKIRKALITKRDQVLRSRGGSRRRRRSIPKSSRKFKKSSKRVFRKKSRSTRRR